MPNHRKGLVFFSRVFVFVSVSLKPHRERYLSFREYSYTHWKTIKTDSPYLHCATMYPYYLPFPIVLIFIVLYIVYRIVKIASRGSPKSLVVSRRFKENDKSTSEDENNQVIGMTKCEYCGSLMPQTLTVCPHCGAPRKE